MEAAWYLCLSSRLPFLVTWPLGITGGSLGGGGGVRPHPHLSFLQGLKGPARRAGAHFPHPASGTGGPKSLAGGDRGKGFIAFPWKTRATVFISCPQRRCWQLLIPGSTLACPQR